MRDIIEINDEVLSLSDVDILILFGLITEKTAFRFTSEQWDEIAGKLVDRDTLPQVADLMQDIILMPDDDIKSIFIGVGLQRDLPHPVIPLLNPIKDPVFVSRSNGIINRQVFHSRRTCAACKPMDKSSLIVAVERTEVKDSLYECPICVLKINI